MSREGKYLYCIISANDGRFLDIEGIGGRGDVVSTIGYQDISAVISNTPMARYVISKENLTAHERVIELVMKDYTVLPMRFCTIASNAEEIRTMLRRRYLEFSSLLRDMDNKIEMGLKVFWKDMDRIFSEIKDHDPDVARMKEEAEKDGKDKGLKVALGKSVEKALMQKKAEEARPFFNRLKRISFKTQKKEASRDDMILNGVFLIDRKFEREFDFILEELSEKYGDRVGFKYVGPAPPYHFINLEIKS